MTLTSVNTAEAKEGFSELVNRVSHHKERVILTRRGKDIAVLIPIEDLILLEESQNKSDLHDAVEALKDARNQGAVTLAILKDEIGIL
jgi:prevent-host-death family protein